MVQSNKKPSLAEETDANLTNEFDLFADGLDKDTLFKQLEKDYDRTVEVIIDKAIGVTANGSFFNFGFYQFISFLFVSTIATVVNGWYGYSIVFIGYVPTHECQMDQYPNNTIIARDSCTLFNLTSNQTFDCDKWTYDRTLMQNTIITEYDFVCKRSHFTEVAYALEQCGYVLGVFVFSRSADTKGRKPIMVALLFSLTALGLVQYFIKNFYAYMSVGFVVNFFASGLDPIIMPLIVEMFQAKQRTIFGIGLGIVWVLVITLLAPLAYWVNTWRELRLAIFIVLAIISVSSIWLVEESLTWLISTNKLDRAKMALERVSKINRVTHLDSYKLQRAKLDVLFQQLSDFNNRFNFNKDEPEAVKTRERIRKISENLSEITEVELTHSNRANVCMEILRHKKFCLYIVIIVLNALSVGLVYDGITLLNAAVGENIFMNWVIMNMVELPAQILTYFVVSRIGRRVPGGTFFIIGGVSLLLNSLNYTDYIQSVGWVKLLLFISAKLSVGIVFGIHFLHVSEIFPTSMRSFGFGFGVVAYETTAVIAPIISLYLTKLIPWLPLVIYGTLSVLSGLTYFYLPETLNRPLPNSIDDVVKWPRHLTKEERKIIKRSNYNCFSISKRNSKA